LFFVLENNFSTKDKSPPYSSYTKDHYNSDYRGQSLRLITEAWFLILRMRVVELPENNLIIFTTLCIPARKMV
jgi:hypothetical protein